MVERSQPGDEELEKTIARLLGEHAAHNDSFVLAPSATIDPKRARELTATLAARRSVPPRIEPRSGLELGPTLGQGGMGVVRSAKQLALDRDVAVKTVQPKLASELATRMLLQEALILGRLEHPNILPVYDIRHEAGEPRIVLKKIEGIEWSSLMHRPELIREELGENDALDWNLEILMTVCNAIHFAHSRGVIHRDLKPENVMIGEFGEVYVMDWGLAVCLEDDGTHRFPLASEAKALAGTPQYMAPEMLGGAEARISERTDVYLLGAILYEIIAGHPPHRGKEMREMLSQVVISRPPIPDRCPSELARICRMAMDPEPGWRFENADALRDALLAFRRHTGSRKLADQAVRRTDELIARIAESRDGKQVASTSVQNLFGECRFAYQQALEAWPENDVARSGLSRATRAMIDHELAQHNPRSAANLLATLESPDAALRTRVADSVTALEQSEARMADLERLRKQLDMSTGTRNRAIGASVLGLVWTVAPLLAPFSLGNPRIGRLPFLLFPAGVLIALGIWAFLARVELRESSVTRRLMRAATIAMLAQLVFESATALLHIDPVRVEALWPLLWFCVSAMLSVTVDRRMWPMTLGFLGALFVGASVPAWRFYAMAGSNLIMTVNMFSIWMPWQKLLLRRAPHADEPRR